MNQNSANQNKAEDVKMVDESKPENGGGDCIKFPETMGAIKGQVTNLKPSGM
jgi:hypothetical protein